jgi:uncharacterized protein (TIGR03435 family)
MAGLLVAGTLSMEPVAQSLAFEAASVKPNVARDGERDGNIAGTRFRLTYATLGDLIHFSHTRPDGNLRNEAEVVGGPSWLHSDRFDIVATTSGMPVGLDAADTAAGAVTSSELGAIDRLRQMMRTLLADRFKLAVHHEMREIRIYELVMVRGDRTPGRRLRKVDVNCAEERQRPLSQRAAEPDAVPCGGFRRVAPGHHQGHGVSVELLADLLEGVTERNVVDRTGLTGVFDIDLEFTPYQPQPRDAADAPIDQGGPSIFTAVREQLGLSLQPARGMVDVLVIDHAERPGPD